MIVILAEKPSVGRDIARVLGATQKHDGYIQGNGYIITWAFGHLVELVEPEGYDKAFKSWNLQSLPIIPEKFRLQVSSRKGVKKQYTLIKKLFKDAETIICATDAGREGELIFRYIQELAGCTKKPAKRLWINSLTDSAIQKGFSNLKPLSDYDNLSYAAKCRSQADWIIGLNATRGYTSQHSHGRGVLSVGRVQTPILSLIVNRDQSIQQFTPEDYWELWTKYRETAFKHKTERFKTEEEALALSTKVSTSPLRIVKIEEKKQSQPPPQLFDLTELQRTMNRLHSYSADNTLKIAQSLYEKKLISYPRSDSRYLTEDIYPQCKSTLELLKRDFAEIIAPLNLEKLTKNKRFFNDTKVSDHHAIIPTGLLPAQLATNERFVYNAITTRLIAAFYPNCEKAHTTVLGEAAEEVFKAKGTRIVTPGWLSLYKSEKQEKKDEEQILPTFTLHEEGPHTPEHKKCQTKPPKHYNESSLLSAMETAGKHIDDEELKEALKERGLGTPATRASIIETLLKRDYILKEGRKLLATDKGKDLIELLQHQATLTSPELTADWEHRLKKMEKGEYEAKDFMEQIHHFTRSVISTLKKESEINPSNLGRCPLCKEAVMKGKTGYGCSAWKNGCPFRFHADQFGTTLCDRDVQLLLHKGRLSHPRKLKDGDGNLVQGYITLDDEGKLGMISREAKIHSDSIGPCPLCTGAVIEKHKLYDCIDCEFVIWKKIASRQISLTLAKVLISKGKTIKVKGFRSKAGKPFSAALKLESGKVCFDFN
jgi:DNA topoisomerase III